MDRYDLIIQSIHQKYINGTNFKNNEIKIILIKYSNKK